MDRRDFLKQISLLPLVPLLDRLWASELDQARDRANVIFVVFDTLSAHHLSLYGYHRETTPRLAEFGEHAIVYHEHYAGGNFTMPGTASLLTGTYPWRNRAFNYAGRMETACRKENIFKLLGEEYDVIAYPHNIWVHLLLSQISEDVDAYVHPTAFALSHDMFYRRLLSDDVNTAYQAFEELIVDDQGPGSLFLGLGYKIRGLRRGRSILQKFKPLYPRGTPALNHYNAHFLVEDLIDGMISKLASMRQPFLAYLHFYPPHAPYRPRREFVGMFPDDWKPITKAEHFFSQGHSQESLNQQRTWYDEYVAHVDAEFGRMCDSLRRCGLMANSYIIFTSDHGELFERGVRGHLTPLLYEPVVHIPLVISAPGQEERRDVHTPTSCVDLLPTFLQLAGKSVPDWCEGQVLPELGGERNKNHVVFSLEAKENAMNRPLTQGTIAMIKGTLKLIHYFGYPGYENEYELYHLGNDPEELDDLYSSANCIAADMKNELKQKLDEVNRAYV